MIWCAWACDQAGENLSLVEDDGASPVQVFGSGLDELRVVLDGGRPMMIGDFR